MSLILRNIRTMQVSNALEVNTHTVISIEGPLFLSCPEAAKKAGWRHYHR